MIVDTSRLKELFVAAAELPPAERGAFLERECGEDAALRGRVDALLRAHDSGGSYLAEQPPVPPAVTEDSAHGPKGDALPPRTVEYRPDAGPGAVIAGRYALVE